MSALQFLRRFSRGKFRIWFWLTQPARMYHQAKRDRQKKGSPT